MISNVDDIGDLTSDEKQKAKSAILLLKDLFSQDLIDLIDEDHPIVQNLSINLAPWTRRWLISLAEAIQILSNQINGSKITSMLRNKNRYRETLLHLCIGKCLVDSNFCLEFIGEKGNKPTPDWKITDLVTNEQFMLELTEISSPTPQQKDILLTHERLSEKLFTILKSDCDPRLVYMGRLLKNFISMPVLQEIYKRIDLAAQSAKKMDSRN
jgi:hypothetical protein